MSLGNNIGMAQAKGKNKPVVIKRAKEIHDAKDYTAFQGSAVQSSAACGVMNGDVNITYYHGGNHALPLTTGNPIITMKRKADEFNVVNGYIKVGPDRGRYFSVQVVDGKNAGTTSC